MSTQGKLATRKKRKQEAKELKLEQQLIIDELDLCRAGLRRANLYFACASEPELIESSVYEIKSLQAKYAYYSRKAKEKGANCVRIIRQEVFPVIEEKNGAVSKKTSAF